MKENPASLRNHIKEWLNTRELEKKMVYVATATAMFTGLGIANADQKDNESPNSPVYCTVPLSAEQSNIIMDRFSFKETEALSIIHDSVLRAWRRSLPPDTEVDILRYQNDQVITLESGQEIIYGTAVILRREDQIEKFVVGQSVEMILICGQDNIIQPLLQYRLHQVDFIETMPNEAPMNVTLWEIN